MKNETGKDARNDTQKADLRDRYNQLVQENKML